MAFPAALQRRVSTTSRFYVVGVWLRVVILVAHASLVLPRWTFPKTTVTVFRLPRGTLFVMGATTMLQFTRAPSVWRRSTRYGFVLSLWCFLLHLLCTDGFPKNTVAVLWLVRGTLPVMGATTTVQLTPASLVLTCTSVRTGLHATPSLSLLKAVSS